MKIDIKNKRFVINGGRPIRTKGWKDNFTIGIEEQKAAMRVIKSGYLSLFEGSHTPDAPFSFWGGPQVQDLEKRWATFYKAKYAVSMNSATSGLFAAIGALGLGFGDEVIVSPFTMSACAACVLIYGAIPIFADVELETGCLDPCSIKSRITPRTKAIVVVHQFGIPADMDGIMSLARKHHLKVIEDCAQAHGALYKGNPVGTIGDIGVFSLNVNKTIQTGEGGVCVTKDKDLRYRLALIRNHGEAVVGIAKYQNIVNIIGFNFRLTEVQAAIAIEQLKKLGAFNKIRLEMVEYLNKKISPFDCFIVPQGRKNCLSTYYVYPLRFLPQRLNVGREKLVALLNAEGIKFFPGYTRPLYLQPLYQRKLALKCGYPFKAVENRKIKTNYYLGACPCAEKLYFEEMLINEHVRFPHTRSDMDDIVKALKKIITKD